VGFDLTRPPALAAGALAILAVVVIWRWAPPPLSPRRARFSLGLRIALLALLTFALAGLQLEIIPSNQAMLVAADLSASTQGALDSEADAVRAMLRARHADDLAGVLGFALQPQVEVAIGADPQFGEFQSRPNRDYTDIAAALRLSGSLLPLDARRHVVLLSDGRANLGDAVAEARLLRAQGIRVDTLPVAVPAGVEVAVDRLDAPTRLQQGERAQASAAIVSNVATPAVARWYLDRTLVSSANIMLQPGDITLTQSFAPTQSGFHSVRLVIDPLRDTYAENNLGEALIQVVGPARVLVVEGAPGRGAAIRAALTSVGIGSVTIAPTAFPRTAAELAAFQSLILVNVPAAALSADAMGLLQGAVRDLGLGLVVIGGDDSYGPGGYAGTPLESALPVRIELPQDIQKPPVAVVLVLESTESGPGDAVLRGAAEAVVDQLTPRDQVGITNGLMAGFAVPLAPLKDKSAVKRRIEAMDLGDPPSYASDLQAASQALNGARASVKHVILLGDGDAHDDYEPYITAMRRQGITVSTVAINAMPADAALMQAISQWGHGRFYQSQGQNDIPQILLQETREALKPWIVEGNIVPRLGSLNDLLAGVPLDRFPVLTGYVATTPRAAADMVLRSPQGDPLLATWQYGLGRVVAWTSDAEGRWTAGLLRWPSSNRLFGDMVRASLPLGSDPSLQVETSVSGDRSHVLVTAAPAAGAGVAVQAIAPDLSVQQAVLLETAPGRFEGDLRTEQVGGYLLRVTESTPGGAGHATTTGLVVPYSPEYRALGPDLPTLRAIARAGGGVMLAGAAQALAVAVPPVRAARTLSELLLVLAILLFPLDVALRRLVVRLEDMPAWRGALRRRPPPPVATEATLARLRDRVEGVRAARRQLPAKKPAPPAPDDPTGELLRRRRGK
jgi:uncharacterized membrane protein